MRIRFALIATLVAVLLASSTAHAAVVSFTLEGTAGTGLLADNEVPAPIGGGTGDIGIGGITYDTDTNMLSLDVRWGSGNGHTDMTGDITAVHLHNSATSPPAGFTVTGGVIHNLVGFDASATSGSYIDVIEILEANEAALLAGQIYLNVHTVANPTGEARGQLIPVGIPTPAAISAGLTIFALVALRRRKP